ncbi:MAG TPA: TIGR00153 family protein [Firmicutes bacterium]|nr:TIGR00153 family protein [Bacillota bacterium]
MALLSGDTRRLEKMVRNVFKIFARSPFEPLHEHLKKCVQTASKAPELIDALKKHDSVTAKTIAKEIMALEHDADALKQEIRDHLPKTTFLPVDRRDLLRLLSAQDDIADRVEDFAVVATLKPGFPVPDVLVEELDRVTGLIMECIQGTVVLAEAMDDLLEAGFGGPDMDRVFSLIHDIGELEWKADKRQYKLSQKLVAIADELKPVDLMLWAELIKNLGRIGNAAERYGKELRNILAR